MEKRLSDRIKQSALSILLAVLSPSVALSQGAPAPVCQDLFKPSNSTASLISTALERVFPKFDPSAEDGGTLVSSNFDLRIDTARVQKLSETLALSDAAFAEIIQLDESPMDSSVEVQIRKGKKLSEALDSAPHIKSDPSLRDFYNEDGQLNLARFPMTSLSLENGRQKLETARIHLSKTDERASIAVITDYLAAAERLPTLKLLIMTNQSPELVDRLLSRASANVRGRIKVVRTEGDLWLWSQDGSKPIDLPMSSLELYGRRYVPANQSLSAQTPVRFDDSTQFFFEGGDVVVGDRHVFIGRRTLDAFLMRFRTSEAQAVAALSTIFQKPVLPFTFNTGYGRGTSGWSFHIDLDLVMAVDQRTQKEVALIRSPELLLSELSGLEISENPTWEDMALIRWRILNRFATGRFGSSHTKGAREFIRTLDTASPHEMQLAVVRSRLLKRKMRMHGYDVRDLPAFGEAQMGRNKQSFFGTNSVLSGRTALVPNNDFPMFDRMVTEIYQGLGYEVIPMKSTAITKCLDGGIRCATETYRKPYLSFSNVEGQRQ